MKTPPLLLLALITVLFSCQQSDPDKKVAPQSATSSAQSPKLAVKAMQEDCQVLWAAIKEMHPAYGIYTSPDSLQAAYNRLTDSINSPMTEDEFITHLYPFLCQLRCGHTQILHSSQYKAGAPVPHLPFEVLVRHRQAWVTTHRTDQLSTGDELISMNDIPVTTMIGHGYELYCGDGYNETFKELFLSEYDGFEDICNKYYHWDPPYKVKLRTEQGAIKVVSIDTVTPTVAAQSGATLSETAQAQGRDDSAQWITAKNTDYLPLRFYKKASVAWFVAGSFQYGDTVIYKEAFKQIHAGKIKTLILDLRHNGGGDIRVAAKLLSYLADYDFHMIREMKSRIPNPAINHFVKYFDTALTESFINGFQPGKQEGAYYHVDFKPVFGLSNDAIPLDPDSHFNGTLFVLIDGATFSSGALSAAAIKAQCKNATFIGRETAGGEEGCSGGTIQHLNLPNTGIVVQFPWLRFVSIAGKPVFGHGLIPDQIVDYSPREVVDKADPDLKTALSMVKNQLRP